MMLEILFPNIYSGVRVIAMRLLFGFFLIILLIIGWIWIFPMICKCFETSGLDQDND